MWINYAFLLIFTNEEHSFQLHIEIVFIGLFAGLLAGMFGLGGGIVIVPSLILILGWDIHLATGTSLATLLLPTGFLALLQYKRANLLYIKGAALIASGIVFGNIAGSSIALYAATPILKQLFGLFQVIMGIKYSRPLDFIKTKKNLKNENSQVETEPNQIKKYVFFIIGIAAGILGGMFGIGGGVIITTLLISAYKIQPKQAIAISLAAMFLPVGLGGVLLYNKHSYVDIISAIIIAIGIEIGSAISAKVAIKTQADLIKRFFGVLLIIIGIYFIIYKFL